MPYRKSYKSRSYSKKRAPRRRKSRSRGGRVQKVVIEVRHSGGAMGPGAVSPTLGKKAPQQLRPRF